MIRKTQSVIWRVASLSIVLALVLAAVLWAPRAHAIEDDAAVDESTTQKTLTNAELRWGINEESAGFRTHQGHNFFSAGDASASLATADDLLTEAEWKSSSGNVRIESAPGKLASWSDAVPTGKDSSGIEIVLSKGKGTVGFKSETANVSWTGTASVVYYSGLSFFAISNPQLTVESGTARLVATLSGYSSSQGGGEWKKLTPESNILIAELPVAGLWNEENGFSIEPKFEEFSSPDNIAGSFPGPFVDYLTRVGISPYFYKTGGSADSRKAPSAVSVSWDSGDRVDSGGNSGSGNSGSKGILGQVIDDTVEDILRSAGTDVADTAAAWMDEAWKPVQPDAVKAAQAAQADGLPVTDTIDSPDSVEVDEEFALHYEEQYSATPMTAGTVGAAVATAPSSSGSAPASTGSSAHSAAPAAGAGAAGSTLPVAANLPLTEVVYSTGFASPASEAALPRWQWWVGGVLLALAMGLAYQVFLRKE